MRTGYEFRPNTEPILEVVQQKSQNDKRAMFLGEKGQVLRKALRYTSCISQRRLTLEGIASRIARCRCARW